MTTWTGYAIWAAGILSLLLGVGDVILWATFPPEAGWPSSPPGTATAILWIGGCCLIALGELVRLQTRQDHREESQLRPPSLLRAKPPGD